MVIPSTAYGVAVLLILVVPGTVYAAVRAAVGPKGPHDTEFTTRFVWAVIASLALNGTYLLALGDWLIDLFVRDGYASQPRAAGGIALGLGIAFPAAAAYVIHGRPRIRRGNLQSAPRMPWPKATTGYSRTPTAWDYIAAPDQGARWVRIRKFNGTWLGGWFGNRSYISTYPEPRDIYIEIQYHMTKDGTFEDPVEDSAGLWAAVEPNDFVEWMTPDHERSDDGEQRS